jgi:GTP-binding protein EngB required for normal cell division
MLDADQDCLELLDSLPLHVTYCVVLTKADKRGGGMRPDILDRINQEIATRLKGKTNRVVPVLLSSSETREGGVAIWSALLDALAQQPLTRVSP